MPAVIRAYVPSDSKPIVALSLRAWGPVFASVEQVQRGSSVYERLHPDWRVDQQRAVEDACAAEAHTVQVAEVEGAAIGFAVLRSDTDANLGEVYMIAVDPDHQGRGIGTLLTERALRWFRDQNLGVAMVQTGGDPGHAPARRTYEKAGFTALRAVKYFIAL